jgi:hypothetical protein
MPMLLFWVETSCGVVGGRSTRRNVDPHYRICQCRSMSVMGVLDLIASRLAGTTRLVGFNLFSKPN